MEYYYSLSDKFISRNIEFTDENGNIIFVYNHKEIYKNTGEITNWKETKLKRNKIKKLDKNNKYYKILDVKKWIFYR